MVVPVGREAGGEVVTKPGKTDGQTDGEVAERMVKEREKV